LGDEYNITKMTMKNHCCCGQTFAAIDAVLALREKHKFAPREIKSVKIYTYQTALDVTGNYRSETPAEARFSLPYVVAYALVHGSVRLAAFEDAALGDELVRKIISQVQFCADEEFNALFPAKRCARAEILLNDGRLISHTQFTRKGDPDFPLTDRELEHKYSELVSPVIGEIAGKELLGKLWSLDKLENVNEIMVNSGQNGS
jgi:2-methylcitrate dehydratase PrpD